MNIKLDGFHGTDMNNVDSILKKGLNHQWEIKNG